MGELDGFRVVDHEDGKGWYWLQPAPVLVNFTEVPRIEKIRKLSGFDIAVLSEERIENFRTE